MDCQAYPGRLLFIPMLSIVRGHYLEGVASRWQVGIGSLENAVALLHVAGGYPLCVDTFQLIAVMGVLAVEVIQCGELESKEVLAVAQ